jgi:HSP20 family protein
VQQKREVEKAQEATRPMRAFLPTTDIFETEDALTLVLEMPGVDREHIDLSVEHGVLTIEGRIDFNKYEGLQPVYSEYNIGPYRRSFRISGMIDQHKITAELRDGVITLVLPKAERAKPRRIEIGSRPLAAATCWSHLASTSPRSFQPRA